MERQREREWRASLFSKQPYGIMATVLCYFDYDMPYHDIMTSVDDEDETYHKTEWSLPSYSPNSVYNVGVILVNIITLILFCCSNQTVDGLVRLTSRTGGRYFLSYSWREILLCSAICCAQAEFRNNAVTVQRLCHPTHCFVSSYSLCSEIKTEYSVRVLLYSHTNNDNGLLMMSESSFQKYYQSYSYRVSILTQKESINEESLHVLCFSYFLVKFIPVLLVW